MSTICHTFSIQVSLKLSSNQASAKYRVVLENLKELVSAKQVACSCFVSGPNHISGRKRKHKQTKRAMANISLPASTRNIQILNARKMVTC
uniref:Uncharacterized protein n=1 Tax=Arundo donax TaxID=35708 RepID=A0A0A9DH31_ARUDO